ncbi:divergent polysaccharide deacetylase family protein [Desulfotomaculum sp. 1211_IL3151]|uniref:divergent polysaccharide deacetylase family protein n=1 Tax=Desulfotomaculum sp. 1211_IL3151 TaxID=3084055 RepID=UPI002FDB547B
MQRKRWGFYIVLMSMVVLFGYFTMRNAVVASKPLTTQKQPILAIVIDDFGGADSHGVTELLALDRPITAAVMPNLINSIAHAEEAHRLGHEVILHQPMEPMHGKASWLGPGAIFASMSTQEIRDTFSKNLDSIPHACGFNNHTGSKITSNKEKIMPMLDVAKSKGIFVLDSGTSSKSQVIPVSKSMHIPWVKRDVFLDDVKSNQHVTKQIRKACELAQKQGYAVAIGHVGHGGNVTAKAIKELIPYIEQQGIKLVPLSEVVKANNGNADGEV